MGRGCPTVLKPYETSCDLWIWAIQIKCDWLIDCCGHGGGGESTFTCTRGLIHAAEGCGLIDPLVKGQQQGRRGETQRNTGGDTREERHRRDWRELSWKVLNSCLHRVLKNQRCWKATRLSLAVFFLGGARWHPQLPRYVFVCCFFRLKKGSPLTSIVLDLASLLFTPFNSKSILWTQTLHSSIGTCGEKIMRDFSFLGSYPFKQSMCTYTLLFNLYILKWMSLFKHECGSFLNKIHGICWYYSDICLYLMYVPSCMLLWIKANVRNLKVNI